jgi:hypothetical protein
LVEREVKGEVVEEGWWWLSGGGKLELGCAEGLKMVALSTRSMVGAVLSEVVLRGAWWERRTEARSIVRV